jgi:hypothetical protein
MLRQFAHGISKRAFVVWLAGNVVTAMAGPPGNVVGGGSFELLSLRASESSAAARDLALGNRDGRTARTFAGLPLFFEQNQGQAPGNVEFLARGSRYQFWISPDSATILLQKTAPVILESPMDRARLVEPRTVLTRTLQLEFLGARTEARSCGKSLMPGTINYFLGSNPAGWRPSVPAYGAVEISDLYPGISVTYYGNDRRLEYDFEIGPEVDPGQISFRITGADKVWIDKTRELVMTVGGEELRQPKPRLYQLIRGAIQEVQGGYRLENGDVASFEVGAYDKSLPLVIDPVLSYSSYFGGNSGDLGLALKVDAFGNVYVVGQTLSTQFAFSNSIPPGAFQTNFQGGTVNGDSFVAKLGSSGTNLIYFTYLGGSGNDGAVDLAVDAAGNAYVTGFTDSTNFPTINALYPNIAGSLDTNFHLYPSDAFVTEVNSNGTGLVFSTYFGGSGPDVAASIALDSQENIYLAGYTYSSNFPSINGAFTNLSGFNDVFVSKLGPGGQSLLYSTYLGGTNRDEAGGIAVDDNQIAYVTGYTSSTNFPITPSVQAITNGLRRYLNGTTNLTVAFDAFIVRLDTTKSGTNSLLYSALFGGADNDTGFRIALDSAGNAYITGSAQSPDFPSSNSITPKLTIGANGTNLVNSDAFLTKIAFSETNASIVYSVLFGSTNNEVGWDVAVDPAGNAFVIGITSSSNFPYANTNGFLRSTNSGSSDTFVTAFNKDASGLIYSVLLGGTSDDFGYGIALDSADNAWIMGRTLSTNFPTVAPLQSSLMGTNDAYLARIVLEPLPQLRAVKSGTNVLLEWNPYPVVLKVETRTNLNASATWTNLAQTPVTNGGVNVITVPATNQESYFRLRF